MPEFFNLGFVINKDGLDQLKVGTILNTPRLMVVTPLHLYLGMFNFYRLFLINVLTVLEKINRLLDDGGKWHCAENHDKSVNDSKELLVCSDFLVHFYPNLPIFISVDSRNYGIGAVVSHCGWC